MKKVLPVGLYAQIIKSIISICVSFTIFSILVGISIPALLTSLGAAAALLTFVFKDSVTSLLYSLQIVFQDIIRVGDWVTVSSFGVDGKVEKITINIVVLRNFDGTCTTVPTSTFLNAPVTNWRHMFEKGGRRIKRSIYIDIKSIRWCAQDELNEFEKKKFLIPGQKDYDLLANAQNKVSNITIFRGYIESYLQNHKDIHKEGFTFLVRELEAGATGIPIELYVFTKDTSWANHESIQADIFDYLISSLPEFNLKAYQCK